MECVYCNDPGVKARTFYKDDLVMAFPTNIPITHGHVLVCPVRCIPKIDDLTKEELIAIRDLIVKLKQILKKVFGAEGFNCAWNEEKLAGQSINHLHFHIVPRKEGDAGIYNYEPREFLYRPGSRPVSPDQELDEVAKLIKEKLD